jgi:hypothetical protein
MSRSLPPGDAHERAAARLKTAGLADERVSRILEQATHLVTTLDALADLDPELPEPSLIWQPLRADTIEEKRK